MKPRGRGAGTAWPLLPFLKKSMFKKKATCKVTCKVSSSDSLIRRIEEHEESQGAACVLCHVMCHHPQDLHVYTCDSPFQHRARARERGARDAHETPYGLAAIDSRPLGLLLKSLALCCEIAANPTAVCLATALEMGSVPPVVGSMAIPNIEYL